MRFQLLGILRRVVAQPMADATSELSCAYDVLSVLNSFVLEAKVPQSQRAQGVAKLKQMAQKYDSIYEIWGSECLEFICKSRLWLIESNWFWRAV